MEKERKNIRTILFDMVGVLLIKDEGYVPKTKEEINARKIEKLYNHLNDQKLLSDIKEKLGLNIEEINKSLKYIPERYKKFDKLWEALPELKKDYKLGVINNGNNLAKKYWMEKFDFSIFDMFTVSAEVGVKKPNPEIYLIACRELNTEPRDCLFLDDVRENVVAADELGMEGIWWDKNKKEESLNKLISFL